MGETTTECVDNEKCPECGEPMSWAEGLLMDGGRSMEVGKFSCMKCGLFKVPKESRATRRGRKLAHDLIDVHCMDKRITQYDAATQIGILREQQHCATCGNAMGEPCTCKGKCDCLYCRIRKEE